MLEGGRYLFIGESRSARACAINATWQNGRLSARTLWNALEAAGINPRLQEYRNLWPDRDDPDEPNYRKWHVEAVLDRAFNLDLQGYIVVALGRKVETALKEANIPHRYLRHPAARGAVRETEVYRAHVREVLSEVSGVS